MKTDASRKMTSVSTTRTYFCGDFKHFIIDGGTIPMGAHQVRTELAYAGGGMRKGGKVTLYTDGKKSGEGEVKSTISRVNCRTLMSRSEREVGRVMKSGAATRSQSPVYSAKLRT